MLSFMRKAKGSISIFLCLIMLPMVTYSSMIIDATRLQSARTTISSAGDLTMNAALSEYEQVLEDMYGLFAVAQNQNQSEEDFKKSLENYFTQTIERQLISGETKDDYAQNMSEELVNMIFSEDETPEDELTNFLEMQVESFNYEPVQNAALANPAVMKRQIIDYMKYKGPVSLVSTLFSKLDFLKNTSKQTKVLENKVNYTKKLSEVEDPCKKAYYSIYEDGDGETDSFGYNAVAQMLNSWIKNRGIDAAINDSKTLYKYMTVFLILKRSSPFTKELTTQNLVDEAKNNGEYLDYSDWDATPEDDTIDDMIAKMDRLIAERNRLFNPSETEEGEFETYYDSIKVEYTKNEEDILQPTVNTVITEKIAHTSNSYPSLANIKNGGSWIQTLNVNYVSGSNPDTVVEQLKKRFDMQMDLSGKMSSVRSYLKYKQALYDINSLYGTIFTRYYSSIKTQLIEDNPNASEQDINDVLMPMITSDEDGDYFKYFLQQKYTDSMYGKFVETYDTLYNDFVKKLSSNKVYSDYENYYWEEAYSELGGLYIMLLGAKVKLDDATAALDEVIKAIDEAEKAKETWKGSISSVDSSSTKSSMMSDYDTTTSGVEKSDVENLKSVLELIKPVVNTMISDLETLKYLDKQILKQYTMTSLAKEYTDLNFVEEGFLKMYSPKESMPYPPDFSNNSIISQNLISNGGTSVNVVDTVDNLIATTFDSVGVKTDDFKEITEIKGIDDKEKFYKTLASICNPVGKETLNPETRNEYEAVKNDAKVPAEGENVTKNSDKVNKNSSAPKEIPKNSPSNENFGEILNAIKGYCSNNDQSNANGDGDANQYAVNNVDIPEGEDAIKNANPGSSLTNATSLLDKIGKIGTDMRDAAYLEEYFTEMFTCRTDALDNSEVVLLNGYGFSGSGADLKYTHQLNTNTAWYGKEIEYIIWGDSDLQANLTKNDVLIYTIRFALNAIYAFTAADIQSFALEVATAIAGWTVIGVPIVQACITIAIALAESAWDLNLLHQGKDVPIYKNATTFVCSPSGMLSTIVTEVTEEVVDHAVNELEEKLDNTIDSINVDVNKSIADYAGNMEQYVNEYIEEQINSVRSSIESQFVTPLINKITPIVTLAQSGTVEIETLAKSAVEDAYSAIENNINAMNDGVVKELSLSFLSEKAQSRKDDLVAKVTDYFKKVNEKISAGSIKDLLIGNSGIITGWLNDFRGKIATKLGDVKKSMLDSLKNATDESAANLKSYMHEQMDVVADEITGKVTDTIVQHAGDVVTDGIDTAASSGGFSLNYKEYCKIFVLMNIAMDETKMLQRAAVLIQANVRHSLNNANASFEMTRANTLVSVNAQVKLGTLFPWVVSDSIDDAGGNEELGLDLTNLGSNYITIDYNGINGY